MSIKVKQKIYYVGTDFKTPEKHYEKINEDYITYDNESFALILDGATSFVDDKKYPTVAWFTTTFAAILIEKLPSDRDAKELVKETIIEMQELCSQEFPLTKEEAKEDVLEMPSASIIFITESNDNINFFTLGDSSILVEFKDETREVEKVMEGSTISFTEAIFESIKEIVEKDKITYKDAVYTKEIREKLISTRRLKNRKEGYWLLGMNDEAVDHAVVKSYPKKDIKHILMYSDGFDPMEDKLVKPFECLNLEKLFEELRAMEEADIVFEKCPRIKQFDDTSALLLEIE